MLLDRSPGLSEAEVMALSEGGVLVAGRLELLLARQRVDRHAARSEG